VLSIVYKGVYMIRIKKFELEQEQD
jgi:hypothetical protein